MTKWTVCICISWYASVVLMLTEKPYLYHP
jgi:hypothetical protein